MFTFSVKIYWLFTVSISNTFFCYLFCFVVKASNYMAGGGGGGASGSSSQGCNSPAKFPYLSSPDVAEPIPVIKHEAVHPDDETFEEPQQLVCIILILII